MDPKFGPFRSGKSGKAEDPLFLVIWAMPNCTPAPEVNMHGGEKQQQPAALYEVSAVHVRSEQPHLSGY